MASAKTRNGNPHHRFASLQTPLICGHNKAGGLKAPGYLYSRLPDVFSLTTHYSKLITQSYILPSIEGGANKAVRGLTECQSEPQRGEHSPLCDGGRGRVQVHFYPANPPSSSSSSPVSGSGSGVGVGSGSGVGVGSGSGVVPGSVSVVGGGSGVSSSFFLV